MRHEDNDQFIFICEGKRVAMARLKEEKPPRDRYDRPRLVFERLHFCVSSLGDILSMCDEHPGNFVQKPFDLAVLRGSQLLGRYRNCMIMSLGFDMEDIPIEPGVELVYKSWEPVQ